MGEGLRHSIKNDIKDSVSGRLVEPASKLFASAETEIILAPCPAPELAPDPRFIVKIIICLSMN
jgi:hypothetical protein